MRNPKLDKEPERRRRQGHQKTRSQEFTDVVAKIWGVICHTRALDYNRRNRHYSRIRIISGEHSDAWNVTLAEIGFPLLSLLDFLEVERGHKWGRGRF